MKVYITKYAITQGIYYTEVEPADEYGRVYRHYIERNGTHVQEFHPYYSRDEWSATLEEAIAKTKELIAHKRKLLKAASKRLDRLEEKDIPILDETRNCIGTAALLEYEENHPPMADDFTDDESLMHGVKATINSESGGLRKICAKIGEIVSFFEDELFSEEMMLYNGLMLCDGSLLKIAFYPELYKIIRTLYGGDGVRVFALPDARGRMLEKDKKEFQPGTFSRRRVLSLFSYIKATKAQWE